MLRSRDSQVHADEHGAPPADRREFAGVPVEIDNEFRARVQRLALTTNLAGLTG